ncbi:MAG: circularly permuted type 2 ATP-grasp protein [Methylococcaceae bacterium]|jgi:uncharacterized circularly permuted ATP-grasp superfamily protein/uncharacterized alpha-E superfamily protein
MTNIASGNSPSDFDIGKQYYATQLGSYDEMYADEEKARPHWAKFFASIERMGVEELERRRHETQRLLRENGVTYNVYGNDQRLTKPWRLDPIPLLISSEEWPIIESGLQQRAGLLDLILKDLYGGQTLIKKGLLPIELVFSHEGFLYPCVGAIKNQQRQLTIYSANLARGPDGRMWVIDDRTQAPSGFGYVLENRTVMTRVLPDIFRDTQVQRLSGFFKAFRQSLNEIAPHNKENPRVVILTPGPLNETYFEHAYLSSYFGYTLVQGSDLMVRDGRVWLKSLEGLQPIDVILRRVDDSFCDPLELLVNSKLGVAGLLEAVRRSQVAVANPLGSSILENPGLLAFLPRLARYFLNEDLILPSVATWWCGQRHEREFVLQNLQHMVVKPISHSHNRIVFGAHLSTSELDELRAQIKAKPYCFVAQEQVSFSTVPAFVDQHVEPRNAVLRNFVVANGSDYIVMPGGLTRVARQKDDFTVSNQAGGISKDTWILTEKPEKSTAIWTATQRNYAVDVVEPLTSRAADNLFWVGRHLERLDVGVRLLQAVLTKLDETEEFKDEVDAECLVLLLRATTQVTGTFPGFFGVSEQLYKKPQAELLALAKNTRQLGTIASNIHSFYQAASSVRDLWSQDIWRYIDNIQRRWYLKVLNKRINITQLPKNLDDLMTNIVAFTGLTAENMRHESGWLMLDSGRRLERSLSLIALIRAMLSPNLTDVLQQQMLEALLICTDSLGIYQRRYRAVIQLPRILELLLQDANHPRSLVYQLQQLSEHIGALPRENRNSQMSAEERLLLKAYTDVRLLDMGMLVNPENIGLTGELEQFLANLALSLKQISELIAQAYFSHSQVPQPIKTVYTEDEL